MKLSKYEIKRYKLWMKAVTSHYQGVTEDNIISKSRLPDVCEARRTLYHLCMDDGINMEALSEYMGKNRTTVLSTLNRNLHLRDKSVEKYIFNHVKKEAAKKREELFKTIFY